MPFNRRTSPLALSRIFPYFPGPRRRSGLLEGWLPGRGDAGVGAVVLGWAAGGVIDGVDTLGGLVDMPGELTGRDGRVTVVAGVAGWRAGGVTIMGTCGLVNPDGVEPAFGVEGVMNPCGRGASASGRLTVREGAVTVVGVAGFAGVTIDGDRFTGVGIGCDLEGVPTGRCRFGLGVRKIGSGALVVEGVVRRGSLPRELGAM